MTIVEQSALRSGRPCRDTQETEEDQGRDGGTTFFFFFFFFFFLIFIFNCKVLTYNTYLQTMYDTNATNRTILYLQKKKLIYNVRYLRY